MAEYTFTEVEVVRVIDGDTVYLRLHRTYDPGFKQTVRWESELDFRLARINTPELKSSDPAEREKALAAKAALTDLLTKEASTLRAVTLKADKYGRYLVELFAGHPEFNINDELIRLGHAKPY